MSSLDLQLLFASCTAATCHRYPTRTMAHARLLAVETASSIRLPLHLHRRLVPRPPGPLPRQLHA